MGVPTASRAQRTQNSNVHYVISDEPPTEEWVWPPQVRAVERLVDCPPSEVFFGGATAAANRPGCAAVIRTTRDQLGPDQSSKKCVLPIRSSTAIF